MKNLTKARIKSNHHGLCKLGYTFATMEMNSIFKNFLSSDCLLQLEGIKEESLVIANQESCGEYVLELCTHRPSRSGRALASS